MNQRYFKLVALNNGREDWMFQQFREGRALFGWSWPDCNLCSFPSTPYEDWNDNQKISWTKTQFLKHRIRPGDRVVIQHKRPLREFLIGEVTEKAYDFLESTEEDFNHFLHVKPLTEQYIPITVDYISNSLRHNLSKRGHYYEIYPIESLEELNHLLCTKPWLSHQNRGERSISHEFLDAKEDLLKSTIETIQKKWPAKYFEYFVAELLGATPGVVVKRAADSGMGWDLLINMEDPLADEFMFQEVPVQCKNYSGIVDDPRAIEDLKRCFQNTQTSLAYLFIMGKLSEDFLNQLEAMQNELEYDRKVRVCLVDQEQIAKLYLQHLHILE